MVNIIAEIASAHEGRMETILKMVDVARESNCDTVKFQIFRAKELVAVDHPKFENYCIKEFSEEEWVSIAEYCRKNGIEPMAEVFDVPSAHIAIKMKVKSYKLHSSIISDLELLKTVASLGTRIHLSTGGSTEEEIQKAIDIIKKEHPDNSIILMHGFQNFPTQLKDIHLAKIPALNKRFQLPVGVQDHVAGELPMAFYVPVMALAMGCVCVEKHFTLDRSLKESDYFSSLNPDELTAFVKVVRDAEVAMGSSSFDMSQEEITYRELLKKSIYTLKDIKKGERFSLDNLCFKRSLESDRILSDQFLHIEGRQAAENIAANTRLTKNMLSDG